MSKHIETILTTIGVPAEKLAEIKGIADDSADFKPDEIIGLIRDNVANQVRNDPKFWETLDEKNVNEEFRKKIESNQYGRASNIVRQKFLKGLGMTEADFADLPEEDRMKLETFIPKVAEKFATSKANDKQLQQELIEARKKAEEAEAKIPDLEKTISEKLISQHNQEKLQFLVLAEMASLGEELTVPAQYLVDAMVKHLSETAAFEFAGLSAKPKQKANPNLDIVDGSKTLTLKDLIVNKLNADKLLQKKDEQERRKVGKADVETDEHGGLAISSHIMARIKEKTAEAAK